MKNPACLCWQVLLPWLLSLVCAVSGGQSKNVSEYQVKAVFIYNFTKFVQWPADGAASTNTPFVVGIVGEDPFGKTLDDALRQESVQNHPIVVERFRSNQAVTGCRILFIAQSEKDRLAEVLRSAKGRAILTVTDSSRAAEQGAMINLRLTQDSVKMEINQNAAESAGLKISSKLLKLARIVDTQADKAPTKP